MIMKKKIHNSYNYKNNICIKMKNGYELMNFTVLATFREEVITVKLENY